MAIESTFRGENHDSTILQGFFDDLVPEICDFLSKNDQNYTDFQNLSPLWIFGVAQIPRGVCLTTYGVKKK